MSVADSISPPPRIGRYASSETSDVLAHDLAPAQVLALGLEQQLVEVRVLVELALLRAGGLGDQRVDLGDRRGQLLRARVALDQRRELQQLHVAGDRAGRVEVRVEAHLAHARADLGDAAHHLVAQHAEGGVAGPRGCRAAPRCAPPPRRRARRGPPRRTAEGFCSVWSPAPATSRPGEHQPLAGAGHRDVQQAPHLGDVRLACSSREALPSAARPGPARRSGGGPACGSAARRARTRSRTRVPWRRASSSPARRSGARARRPPPRAARRPPRRSRTRRSRARCGRAAGAPMRRRGRRTWRCSRAARATRSWSLKRCCLRSPIRSIRRCTNRSGRISSNARHALRCSRRKFSMRSRPSGGTSGDSSAARSAGDHVGLAPPRDRACSGRGRPAPARPAGASGRAPPRARRAGRPAGAARRAGRAPRRARRSPRRPRAGRGCRAPPARSPSSCPSLRTERTSTAVSAGSMPSAISRSSSLGHRLRLRALVLAAPERHRVEAQRGPAARRAQLLRQPLLVGLDDRVRGVEDRLVRAVVGLQPDAPSASGNVCWKSTMFLREAPRKR